MTVKPYAPEEVGAVDIEPNTADVAHDRFKATVEALAAAQARVAELEKLVFVPGLRRCAKCGFVQLSQTLHYPSGALSVNDKPVNCANGCGPMWPVTERQAGNEAIEREEKLQLEVRAHEHVDAWALEMLGDIESFEDNRDLPCLTVLIKASAALQMLRRPQ